MTVVTADDDATARVDLASFFHGHAAQARTDRFPALERTMVAEGAGGRRATGGEHRPVVPPVGARHRAVDRGHPVRPGYRGGVLPGQGRPGGGGPGLTAHGHLTKEVTK